MVQAVACFALLLLTCTAAAATPTTLKRPFIFAFNPGYSGSGFLRLLLSTAHDVKCFQEAPPALVHFPAVLEHGLNDTYADRRDTKVPAIYAALRQPPFAADPHLAYCDTSHLFAKSWYDVFADEFLAQGHPVHVIHLKRYLPDVARSALGVGKRAWSPSPHPQLGGEYHIPHSHFTVLGSHRQPAQQDSLDLIAGYVLDMEAQFIKIQQQYPNFKVHDFYLDTATDERIVRQLFRALNITYTDRTTVMLRTRHFNSHITAAARAVPIEAYR